MNLSSASKLEPVFEREIHLLLCGDSQEAVEAPFHVREARWTICLGPAECLAALEGMAPDGIVLAVGTGSLWALQFLSSARAIAESQKSGLFVWLRDASADAKPFFSAGATEVFQGSLAERDQQVRLWARLSALQNSLAREDEHVLRYKDLVLDCDRVRASRAGQPVPLSSLHVQLLKLLISRPSHVFTKLELQESIWRGNTLNEANLRTCFRRLRNAINHDGLPELVHVVRGVGYVLDAENSTHG